MRPLAQLRLRFICGQITLNDITPLVMLINDYRLLGKRESLLQTLRIVCEA